MTKFMTTAAAITLLATGAYADGPGTTWDRPSLTPPVSAWHGVYGGVGITTQRSTTKGSYTESTGEYTKQCALGTKYSYHTNNKCQISDETFNHLKDTGQFEVVSSPWNKNLSEPVIYDGGNYKGIWMANTPVVEYTTTLEGDEPTSARKGGVASFVSEVLTDVFTLDSNEEVAANLFAGYRHVFDNGLGLGVEAGSIGYVEGQLGATLGYRTFVYTGLGTEGVSVGVDTLIGNGGLFGGLRMVNSDDPRGEIRIGVAF